MKDFPSSENIPESIHTTVLLHESIDGLAMRPGDVYLDGTLGAGGHAEFAVKTAELAGGSITIVGLDQDAGALERTKKRLSTLQTNNKNSVKIFLIQQNYRNLDKALDSVNIPSANRIMLDLGLSSDQFETSGRGFSFKNNEPLLMTFKENPLETEGKNGEAPDLTARRIVNEWDESNIADVIYGYGEERYSRKIAKGIVEARKVKPIETTFDLVEIINNSTPTRYHHAGIHPATRTFQALRITVNDEIGALKEGLAKGWERLAANAADGSNGRMAVISFHSIEDRIVKHFYKSVERNAEGERIAKIITKKPITASHQEISENPRSRSAKLRIIEKI